MGRRRKQRFRDVGTVGRSGVCPFVPGESAKERHARRLKTNVERYAESARAYCAERGILMAISNGQHHWRFVRGSRIVEWWPSSAKCVTDKQWRRGVHVHDWEQLRAVLVKVFGLENETGVQC